MRDVHYDLNADELDLFDWVADRYLFGQAAGHTMFQYLYVAPTEKVGVVRHLGMGGERSAQPEVLLSLSRRRLLRYLHHRYPNEPHPAGLFTLSRAGQRYAERRCSEHPMSKPAGRGEY